MISWQELAKQQQNVLDTATSAITTTKKTQTKLEQQLDYADKVVVTHDKSFEAHPDMREQMSRFFDPPTISGPEAVEYGEENTWQFNAVSRTNIAVLEKFYIDLMDGTRIIIPANPDGPTSWSHTFIGERNTYIWFSVMAYGSTFLSEKTTQELWLTQHLPPNMTKMTCTLPTIVNSGQTYTFRYSGIYDEDGDLARVDVSASSEHIQISTLSDLQPDTDYTLTVTDGLVNPENISVTFVATDLRLLTSTRTFIVHINGLPNVSNLTHTFPNRITANTTIKARISGITDPDGEPADITYSIASSIPEIVFSKSSGIKQNEDITVICADVAPGTPYTFTITALDKDGATTQTTIDSTINQLPVMTGLTTNLHDYMYPGENQTDVQFTGGTDADDNVVVYSLATDYPNVLQFSKANNIQDQEAITVSMTENAIRGQTYTYRVTGTDMSNASTTVTRNVYANRKILASEIKMTLEPNVKCTEPETEYIITLTPESDADSQVLTYTVTSNDDYALLERLTANTYRLVSPSTVDVPRGSDYSFTVVADDGYEQVTTTKTLRQNSVPDVSQFELVTVKYLTAGMNNSATVIGVTDIDNTAVTFSVASSLNSITFPANNGQFVPDLPFDIIVDAGAVPGQTFTLTFTFTDADGGVSQATYQGQINAAPDITAMTLEGLPQHLIPGTSYPLTVRGAVDPNNEGITYSISNPSVGLSFSKTSQIAEGEEFSLVVAPEVVRNDTLTFVVSAVDPSNATTGRTYSSRVNQILDSAQSVRWIPSLRHPNTTTWASTVATVDADGHPLAYSVTSDNEYVKFCTTDTSTGQTVNDLVTLDNFTPTSTKQFGFTIDPAMPRGTVVNLDVTVSDGYEVWRGNGTVTIKQFPTNFRTDQPIVTRGGEEFSIDVPVRWDDPDVVLGYDSTLTTWTGYTDGNYKIGNAGTVYRSGDTVHFKLEKVATDTTREFTIRLSVTDGISIATNDYTLSTTSQPIYVTAQPTISYPVEGQEVPYEGYTFMWSEAVQTVDLDQNNVYPSDGSQP